MIDKLKKVANKLDELGLYKEADEVDSIIRRLAQDPNEMRKMSLQRAKVTLLDNIIRDLEVQKSNIPTGYVGEDRGNLKKAVDRAITKLNRLKNPAVKFNRAQGLARAYISDLPDIYRMFDKNVTFSDIFSKASDEKVNSYLNQAIAYGHMAQKEKAAPGGAAGDKYHIDTELAPGSLKRKYKRGPNVAKFQKMFNQAIQNTPYADKKLTVDGIRGPNTMKAEQLVKQMGGLAGLKRQLPSIPSPKPPALPPGASQMDPSTRAVKMLERSGVPLSDAMIKDVQNKAERTYKSLSNKFDPDTVKDRFVADMIRYIDDLKAQVK